MTAISDEGIKADENNYNSVRTGDSNFNKEKSVKAATERTFGGSKISLEKKSVDEKPKEVCFYCGSDNIESHADRVIRCRECGKSFSHYLLGRLSLKLRAKRFLRGVLS